VKNITLVEDTHLPLDRPSDTRSVVMKTMDDEKYFLETGTKKF
jgi:hypothetical protein